HGVQVDRVRRRAGGAVGEMQGDGVALADAQQRAGDGAVEGPVGVGGAVLEHADELLGGEEQVVVARCVGAERRGQVGGVLHDLDRVRVGGADGGLGLGL